MRIGFDAKRAFANNTGLGHYSRNLFRALQQFHLDHEYVLYTPKIRQRGDFSFVERSPNVRVVTPTSWYERAFPSVWRSFWVKRNIHQDRLDIYHGLSHELPVGLESSSVKKVVTIHDLIFLRYPSQYSLIDRSVYKAKFQHACKLADIVIAVSQQTERDLIEFFGVPPEKIRVVYQAAHPSFGRPVDLESRESVRRRYRLPSKFILSVGSIIERKNLLRVVQALDILKSSLDPFLVVVGKGGAYEKRVRQYVKKNGLTDRVHFLGSVPQEDLVALHQMAEVFVYPSLFEGFGIPIMDSLACGVPVITSRGSCFSESGGPGSIYVNPLKCDELASAVKTVLNDRSLRERMVATGKEYVQRFDAKRLSSQLMQIYQGLLDPKRLGKTPCHPG